MKELHSAVKLSIMRTDTSLLYWTSQHHFRVDGPLPETLGFEHILVLYLSHMLFLPSLLCRTLNVGVFQGLVLSKVLTEGDLIHSLSLKFYVHADHST